MHCPFCDFRETRVIDKRENLELKANRRRRECAKCGKRFTTYEKIDAASVITTIRKRDGRLVPFNQEKIANAIFKATQAVGGSDRKEAERLSNTVVGHLARDFAGKVPTVEQIQDVVERTLVEAGHYQTAKAYILYRKQRSDARAAQAKKGASK